MRKKGFTLIEILGIFVVIAIIALITVPIISGIIVKARKSSYKDSAYAMIESATIYLAQNMGIVGEEGEINFICDGKSCEYKGDKLPLKGPIPISGIITVTGKGETTLENVYNGKYYANKEVDEDVVISEEVNDILSRKELTKLLYELKDQYAKDIQKIESQHQSDIANLQNKINTLEGKAVDMDEIYPVGSIYTTTSNVNPSTLFAGTTWERYGVGRTLLSTDGGSGEIGGSNSVVLTPSNLPSHSHSIPSLSGTANSTGSGYSIGYVYSTRTSGNQSANHTHSFSGSTGLGYTSFMRIVKNLGFSNNSNHVVGFESSSYLDVTNTSDFPGGNHYHSFSGTTGSNSANHTHNYNDYYANSISGVQAHTHSVTTNTSTTGSIGSGASINIQNPYITVYMWKRVS